MQNVGRDLTALTLNSATLSRAQKLFGSYGLQYYTASLDISGENRSPRSRLGDTSGSVLQSKVIETTAVPAPQTSGGSATKTDLPDTGERTYLYETRILSTRRTDSSETTTGGELEPSTNTKSAFSCSEIPGALLGEQPDCSEQRKTTSGPLSAGNNQTLRVPFSSAVLVTTHGDTNTSESTHDSTTSDKQMTNINPYSNDLTTQRPSSVDAPVVNFYTTIRINDTTSSGPVMHGTSFNGSTTRTIIIACSSPGGIISQILSLSAEATSADITAGNIVFLNAQ